MSRAPERLEPRGSPPNPEHVASIVTRVIARITVRKAGVVTKQVEVIHPEDAK